MAFVHGTICNFKHKFVYLQPCAAREIGVLTHRTSKACLDVQQTLDVVRRERLSKKNVSLSSSYEKLSENKKFDQSILIQ